jgi:CBS-domain-containing membrane protein
VEELTYASDKRISNTVTGLGVIFSFALFIPAVWAIEKTDSLNAKLGALTGFILLFTIVVVTLTRAQRMEVITSTAAYAAVLIVLIGRD